MLMIRSYIVHGRSTICWWHLMRTSIFFKSFSTCFENVARWFLENGVFLNADNTGAVLFRTRVQRDKTQLWRWTGTLLKLCVAATIIILYVQCGISDHCCHLTSPTRLDIVLSSRLDYVNALHTARHVGRQPWQAAGDAEVELTGSDNASGPSFYYCNRVTSAASLVASSPTDHLQYKLAVIMHLQDAIHQHPSLLVSTRPELPNYITIVRQTVTWSGTSCHITVDQLSFSALLNIP